MIERLFMSEGVELCRRRRRGRHEGCEKTRIRRRWCQGRLERCPKPRGSRGGLAAMTLLELNLHFLLILLHNSPFVTFRLFTCVF